MTFRDTLFFIGQCLTINHEEKNKLVIETHLATAVVDWEAVVKVSSAHYVMPALYLNLSRANFLHYLPEDLVAFMEHITNMNRERNEQLIAQSKELNALLQANGIPPIFLKGIGNLLDGLYKDIGERMVGDIDFLVAKEHFFRAVAILKDHHYIASGTYERGFHWHYPRLIHQQKIGAVEIHDKILKDHFQDELGIGFIDHLKTLPTNILVLSDHNKLLATTLQKIINDNLYHKKNITLRTAYDVFLISKLVKMDISSIQLQGVHTKLTNYLSCIQHLLSHPTSIIVSENPHTKKYIKKFEKVLHQNSLELFKNDLVDFFITNKNRMQILKFSFNDATYRKYVLKRIFQLDFYRELMKKK